MNIKYSRSSAPHNRKDQPQAYFILRALYTGPDGQTREELARRCGYCVTTISKRPRLFRAIGEWCKEEKVGRAYVYSRIPGKTRDQVLKEFRGDS